LFFGPKQGPDFEPVGAPRIPKLGQGPPPPPGGLQNKAVQISYMKSGNGDTRQTKSDDGRKAGTDEKRYLPDD